MAIHAPELDGAIDWLNTDHPLTLRELRGQLVLLDFWTYCCINCLHVLATLRDLEARHAADPLVVVGVLSAKFSEERDPRRVAEALERHDIRHPVAVDSGMRIWRAYAVRAWPTLVLVRPDGTVASVAPGEPDPAVLEAFVARELDEARRAGTLARRRLERARPAPREETLAFPGKVAVARDGRLAVSDSGHHRVLVADAAGRVSATVGSGLRGLVDGGFADAAFDDPQGLCWDGEALWIADRGNHAVRRVDLAAGTVRTVAGTGALGPMSPARDPRPAREVALRSPWDVALAGDALYVAMAGAHQVWRLAVGPETIAPWAGSGVEALHDGTLADAALAQPSGLALDGERTLYVADAETSAVRAIDLAGGRVTTLVGAGLFDFGDVDGPRDRARLQHCLGVALGPVGLLVADTFNHKVKRIARRGEPDGARALYGGASAAVELRLDEPGGLAFAPDGTLVVADTNHHRLLRVAIALDHVSATPIPLTGAPRPREGVAVAPPAPPPAPPLAASGPSPEIFTAYVAASGEALGEGRGELVLDLTAADGEELAAHSPLDVALEVTRRSDLLVLPPRVRVATPGGRDVTVRFLCRVLDLRADRLDAEVVLTLDYVACDAHNHALCAPGQARVRIPIRLARDGAAELRFELALPPANPPRTPEI